MKKYFVELSLNLDFTAGHKAKSDIECFLRNVGFEPLQLCKGSNYLQKCYSLFLNILNPPFKRKEIVLFFIQYPFINIAVLKLYRRILNKRGYNIKYICLIHDLNSIRNHWQLRDYQTFVNEEIKKLNNFDYLISHNFKMTEWLVNNGINKKVVNLGLFDYMTKDINDINYNEDKNNIVFAGNLSKEKSGFIYSLDNLDKDDLKFLLYGPCYNSTGFSNIDYKGVFYPDELPSKLTGAYGLIWDGNSLFTCSGAAGNYLRYNNPHKLSLYIASCLPVIVWSESAISTFVKKYNIGIVVKDLYELPKAINSITKDKYILMKQNVIELSKNVRSGYYINNCLDKIIGDIK